MPKRLLPLTPQLLLLLFPLVLGLFFQSHGSGNGDSAAYRSAVCLIEFEGHLPVTRLEWSHPLHILVCWALTRLGAAAGLFQDPFYAVQALNWLLLGVLALVVARTWFVFDADRRRALLAGLAIAILPGWAWHAQEPLSDVSGHSLVALCVCALLVLRHERQHGRPGLWRGALAGVLAGAAFLFRPGAGLFLPLLAWLTFDALRVRGGERLRCVSLVLAGGLVPIVAIYAHLLVVHGLDAFVTTHFAPSVHNMAFRDAKASVGLAVQWAHHTHRALGSFAFLMAGTGWILWLLSGTAGGDVGARRRGWLVIWLVLLALGPYFVFLLGNGAAGEFRFALPVQLILAIGIVPLLGHLGRHVAPRWQVAWLVVFVASSLHQASLQLVWFATREHFVERAAQELVAASGPNDILLAGQVAPYAQFRRRFGPLLAGGWGQPFAPGSAELVVGVRPIAFEEGADFWNRGWRSVERQILGHLRGTPASGRVLLSNEAALAPFQRWLALRGFEERELVRVPARTLRHRLDAGLESMDPVSARQVIDLVISELRAPALAIERVASGGAALVGPVAWSGQWFSLFAGRYDETQPFWLAGAPWNGSGSLPARAPIARGRLGEGGRVELPVALEGRADGEVWVAVVRDGATDEVLGRSHVFFPDPTDDVSSEIFAGWVRGASELRVR